MNRADKIPQLRERLEDKHLYRHFLEGDDSAFVVLYHRYSARILGYIRSLVGAENHAADDIFQETFIRLYRERSRESIRNSREISNVGGWLFRVSRNLSLNFLRDNRLSVEELCDNENALVTPVSEAFSSIYSDDRELRLIRLVHQAVKQMTPALREIFILKEVNGMTYAETSQIVGCTTEAARMRMSRARNFIRGYVVKFEAESERLERRGVWS